VGPLRRCPEIDFQVRPLFFAHKEFTLGNGHGKSGWGMDAGGRAPNSLGQGAFRV